MFNKYVKENLNEIKTLTMHTRSDNMYKELDYIELIIINNYRFSIYSFLEFNNIDFTKNKKL